jgi:hypothetical protein
MKPFTARKVSVKYFSALNLIISASLQNLDTSNHTINGTVLDIP